MGTGIDAPPNTYNFGHEFDYAVWTPGTVIDLCNVPWDNNYRDIVRFQSRASLNEYIDNHDPERIRINQLSYVKPNTPIRINVPHNVAIKYNYVRVSNPAQPIPNDEVKAFYYFILDVNYIAPGTTELVLQLDIVQTYIYDIKIGNCYVERGHIGIANYRQFDSFGRDYLTVPEGFDLGSDYRTIHTKNETVMNTASPIALSNPKYPGFDILVFSATDLYADPGTKDDPDLVSADGTVFQNTMQGANVYIFTPEQFYIFMGNAKETPWITQGILSITVIPKISRYHPDFEYSEGAGIGKKATTNMPNTRVYNMLANWRNSSEIIEHIPERYRHLKKFWTSPYMMVEMTTFTATPLALRPEAWHHHDARIFERASLVPPGNRIEFSPRFYNAVDFEGVEDLYPPPLELDIEGDDEGEYLDLVTQIANFPTMSIVNDGAISYLAANTHGIAFQHRSADWTQQRALGMNQAQYDIATQAMHTIASLSGAQVNADIAQTANVNRTLAAQGVVNAVGSVLGAGGNAAIGAGVAGPAGAVAGAAGGIAGAVTGAVNTGIQIGANDEALAIRNTAAAQQVIANQRQTQVARDTNRNVADWAARGDYANQIAGINAKVQDAQLIQPTTSGQIGGETINMVNGGWRLSLRWKLIDKAAIRRIGDYWLRYGYAIRAFIKMPETLMVMTKFTYWKLTETYIISGPIPEAHKAAFRGVFEKGVTVWADPGDIGNIDIADNEPLEGIEY